MPNDAEVQAIPPYNVRFDVGPPNFYHIERYPNPKNHTVAGFTNGRPLPHLSIQWAPTPTRGQGKQLFFADSVDVTFELEEFIVSISSAYSVGTCPYDVTLRHEYLEHVYPMATIFQSYRAPLIRRLNAIKVPTRGAPLMMRPCSFRRSQERLVQQISTALDETKWAIVAALEEDRALTDSPANYRKLQAQCPKSDWKTEP